MNRGDKEAIRHTIKLLAAEKRAKNIEIKDLVRKLKQARAEHAQIVAAQQWRKEKLQ
jgi:hypothetical protein